MTWHLCDDLTPTSPPCKRPTPNPLTNYRRRAGPGLCLPSESIALLLHSIVMVTVAQEANQMIGFPFTTIFFPCGGYLWPPLYGSHLFYFSGCELVYLYLNTRSDCLSGGIPYNIDWMTTGRIPCLKEAWSITNFYFGQ